MSLRASGLARLASYSQHSSDTTCHTLVLKKVLHSTEVVHVPHDNSLVVISWHTPWRCVRVLIGRMSIQLSEDDHDSWVTCTTSAECKTVITAVLTVMSGMDPHMISWNLGWVGFVWLVEVDFIRLWVGHGVTP
jgi:hypothetical protein